MGANRRSLLPPLRYCVPPRRLISSQYYLPLYPPTPLGLAAWPGAARASRRRGQRSVAGCGGGRGHHSATAAGGGGYCSSPGGRREHHSATAAGGVGCCSSPGGRREHHSATAAGGGGVLFLTRREEGAPFCHSSRCEGVLFLARRCGWRLGAVLPSRGREVAMATCQATAPDGAVLRQQCETSPSLLPFAIWVRPPSLTCPKF